MNRIGMNRARDNFKAMSKAKKIKMLNGSEHSILEHNSRGYKWYSFDSGITWGSSYQDGLDRSKMLIKNWTPVKRGIV